jgi:integrase-like protein
VAREVPPWVFCSKAGTPLNNSNLRRVFRQVLKRAKLPPHFSPHSLRHTFASLLLQQGESPVYVQRQLGHASIKLTVDTYGKWLPMGNKAAVDRLDDKEPGSKVVAKLIPAGERAVEHVAETSEIAGEKTGEPCGTRTHDPLIKRPSEAVSQLLDFSAAQRKSSILRLTALGTNGLSALSRTRITSPSAHRQHTKPCSHDLWGMRARRRKRSGELAAHNFYRLAHLRGTALARTEPSFAAPTRSLVTFLSRVSARISDAEMRIFVSTTR